MVSVVTSLGDVVTAVVTVVMLVVKRVVVMLVLVTGALVVGAETPTALIDFYFSPQDQIRLSELRV